MAKADTAGRGSRRHGGRYVYDSLRTQILTLALKPGTQLDEVSLAEQFELSRSPVRDALARLMSEGLVTMLPNRTTMVTPFDVKDFPHYIAALDLVQRAVTRFAAAYRRDADLEAIRAADEAYIKVVSEGQDFPGMSECNKRFHLCIAEAGQNPYFISHYERLLGEGQRILHLQLDYIMHDGRGRPLGRDHDALIDAIARQDVEAADEAAHQHTVLFQQRFLEFMQQNATAGMAIYHQPASG
ncbi:GntR family transcriptional regulator [Gammaproteobacteria bacterium MFB021]|nr:GntR family transcriptional regulator [Gammaproteobacteria bacterium MFB021]